MSVKEEEAPELTIFEEAQQRRQKLKELYSVTDSETEQYLGKLVELVSALPEHASMDDVVALWERVFEGGDERQQELKHMLIASMAGKIEESMRYFLPTLPESLLQLQQRLIAIVGAGGKTVQSFGELREILKEYEPILDDLGITEEVVAQAYVKELRAYLKREKV